jgi:lipid A ethanolaminephosphotransferase
MRELDLAFRRKHEATSEVSVGRRIARLPSSWQALQWPVRHAALAGSLPIATWCFTPTLIALIAVNFIAIGVVATRHIVRPLAAILIVVSMCAAHYMQSYGIVLDAAMLRNVLHTDLREAAELVGAGGALGMGLAAAGLLWTVRLRKRPIKSALLVRMAALTVCAIVGLAALAAVFQDFSSTMRNVHSLRYTISPGNIVWGLGQVLAADAHAIASVREPSEPAYRTSLAATARKPVLLVIVVGETARAANFSLNGYARATNPELARLDVINFGRATACGTSTEVSLPCMFSPFGRADYDAQRIRRHDSLLHVLAHTGMRVVWLDNQSGCKGVCDGLDATGQAAAGLCAEGRHMRFYCTSLHS